MEEARGIKRGLENIIEKYNAYIQAALLLFALCFGIYEGIFCVDKQLNILISIVSVLLAEIFILNIKDSIGQRKLNEMKFSMNTLTQFFPFNPELLENFKRLINESTTDLFISGITCTNVLDNHYNDIILLLEKGVYIRLLISSEEAIDDNAKFYFGLYDETNDKKIENRIKEARHKMTTSFGVFEKYPQLLDYYCKEKLEIKRTSRLISTGFVGTNIYCSDEDIMKIIKVTHYMYGCNNTSECPRELYSSTDNNHWYGYYLKYIKEQWKQAVPYRITDCSIR